MATPEIRLLTENDWHIYRELRLRALQDSPDAFVATHEDEEKYGEDLWRARMRRSARIAAYVDGHAIGVLSIRHMPISESGRAFDQQISDAAEVFAFWVDPNHRRESVAEKLLAEARKWAREHGFRFIVTWISTDNIHALAFVTGYGFQVTDTRRSMKTEAGSDEMALVFPLDRP